MKQESEARLAEQAKKHGEESARQQEEHGKMLAAKDQIVADAAHKHAAEVKGLKAELAAQTARLQMEAGAAAQSLTAEIERLKQESEARLTDIAEMSRQHNEEKELLLADHSRSVAALKANEALKVDCTAELEAKFENLKEEMEAQAQEFEEHIVDLEEESGQRIEQLEKMVLEGKRQINSLLSQMIELPDVREVLAKIESLEKQKLEQDIALLDLKEELERAVKMGDVSNSALVRAQEELESLRDQRHGGMSVRAPTIPEQIRKYEETLRIQQQHNVFLSNELNRLETEQQSVLAAKDKSIAFILHSLRDVSDEMRRCRRIAVLKDAQGGAAVLQQVDTIEELRKELFFSKAIACKVDRATRGIKTNLNIAELWERAQHMQTGEFDKLIQFELESTNQSPVKRR